MILSPAELAYVRSQGLYVTEKCAGCGKLLNQTVRYTVTGKPGVYCSAGCRDRAFFQCWQEARRRFGYTRIEPFDSTRGAAFYAAKYAGRAEGTIHFGGTLAGVDLSNWERSPAQGGGRDIAVSGALAKDLFHLTLPRRHR